LKRRGTKERAEKTAFIVHGSLWVAQREKFSKKKTPGQTQVQQLYAQMTEWGTTGDD